MSQAKEEPDLGDYTDYLLLSSSALTQGWKHNIMRLAPASTSDEAHPAKWAGAKLNRRDMRRIRREEEEMVRKAAEAAQAEEQAAAGTTEPGSANDIVKKEGGYEQQLRPGMPGYSSVKVEVKEERDDSLVAPGSAGTSITVGADGKAKTTINRPRRGFGAPKKTRRVFITEESAKERRIHFEEQHPWMLETSVDDKKSKGQNTRWLGKMDAAASAVANGGEGSSYVLLVLDNSPSSEAAFKVAPANRWYRFTSRPRYATMNGEEAEQEYQKMQKTGDMDLWFAQRRANLPSGSAASQQQMPGRTTRGPDSAMGSNGTAQSSGYKSRLALARGTDDSQGSFGSRRLKTVVNDDLRSDDLDAEDYEPSGPAGKRAGKAKVKPRKRAGLADDEYEEFDYEEDFQDDEEGIGQVGDEAIEDTDTKELEERIKKEMRGANFPGHGVEAADEDDEIGIRLTKAGKKVKKLLQKRGRKGRPEEEEDDFDEDDDDDDDTRNPYASEESDEDSDAERERLKKEEEKKKKQQYPGQAGLSTNGTPAISRNNSNAPKYPGGSVPLSRAPSTGPPGSRAASPSLASNGNLLKRATSPSGTASRAASPTPPPSASKRKADEGGSPSASDADKASKRRKPGSPSPAPAIVPVAPGDDSALIPRSEIIAFIKEKMPSTKELLRHFKQAMARDSRNKNVILQVTKEVATISEGKLAVKPEFV